MIRKANSADLKRIMEIEVKSFFSPWPAELLSRHLGEDGFLVYEQEGIVIGYMIVGLKIPSLFARLERRTQELLWGKQEQEEEEEEEFVGHIMNLAIDPAYRRKGLGSELLTKGLEYLQQLGAQTVELEVRVGNEAAIKLYQKFGFVIKDRIKNYYHNGDDAYLMVKSL